METKVGIVADVEKLKQVSQASYTAKMVVKYLLSRERSMAETNITKLPEFLNKTDQAIFNEKDYLEYWNNLEKLGLGSVVIGRGNIPSIFKWNYSLRAMAAAASGKAPARGTRNRNKKKSIVRTPRVLNTAPVVATPKHKHAIRDGNVLFITLRPDFDLTIDLPKDISKSEIKVISAALERFVA